MEESRRNRKRQEQQDKDLRRNTMMRGFATLVRVIVFALELLFLK